MRIAILCPHFPPEAGGVSDYTAKMAGQIAKTGRSVAVWTAVTQPEATPGVELFSVPASAHSWTTTDFERIEKGLLSWAPSLLLVQYTPYMYGPKSWGLHPALSKWMAGLRKRIGCPVAMTVHELHYPVGLTPDRLLVGTPQLAQFFGGAAVADALFFTNEKPAKKYGTLFPWKKGRLFWLPVGATIEPEITTGTVSVPGIPPDSRILFQFGSSHPSRLFDLSFAALLAAQASTPDQQVHLVFGGLSAQDVEKRIQESSLKAEELERLRKSVHGTGYLSTREISAWMKRADLVLAPFVDGVSTRRTSVMAALAHGRPVVTTSGSSTDPSIHWERYCAVADARYPKHFATRVVELLQHRDRAQQLGDDGKAMYERSFAWSVLAERLISDLETVIRKKGHG